MRTLHFLALTLLLASSAAFGQSDTNESIVKKIYDAIQNNDAPKLIADLTPDLKWYNSNRSFDDKDKFANRQSLEDILSLLNNEWIDLKLHDLTIEKIEENIVLATGTVSGRSTEQDTVITKEFHHLWWFKNGKIIKFLQ